MGCKRWPQAKPRKLCMWWYWYIYYDGSQYKDIFLLHEIFNDKYWWVTSYEIAVRIIYLKVCSHTPMLVNFTYWVISPPFIFHYRYIKGIIGVEILGRQQLRTILWNWGFYYYFMALNIVLKNYFEDVLYLVIRALIFVMRF